MANDRNLIRRLRRGDPDALGEIYQEHKDRLLTLAICLLPDRSAAEDCLQDVFLRLARGPVGLRVRRNLKSYLSSCVLNRARDELRKAGRHVLLGEESAGGTEHPAPNPSDRLEGMEEALRIQHALARLPQEQREVVVLHLQDGLTFRRIAALQSVSINTAQSRYRYGIQRLRELLPWREER